MSSWPYLTYYLTNASSSEQVKNPTQPHGETADGQRGQTKQLVSGYSKQFKGKGELNYLNSAEIKISKALSVGQR